MATQDEAEALRLADAEAGRKTAAPMKELTKGQQTPKTLVPQGVTDYPSAVVR